ncbi:MAG: M23 family metallopeptidase [Lachnospiraceae bacterium]|nr:M23 family metallopeptidase [Lachnospiraceae bacterium]
MIEDKESFWKKKGFYLSVCTAMVCLLAVGTVYYKMNYGKKDNGGNLFAETQTEDSNKAASNKNGDEVAGKTEKTTKTADISDQKSKTNEKTEDKKDIKDITDKKIDLAENNKANKKSNDVKDDKSKSEDKNDAVTVMSGVNGKHTFNEEKGLIWPVNGDVILKYSMNNTVYFKTLAQYKCNPAIAIAAKKGTAVKSAADGTVIKVGKNEEIGNYVTVDIGSNYTVTYGQLKDITVNNGKEVKEGELLGKIAEPTKYYTEEGSNLYLQVMENGKTVDPLLVLR